MIRVASRKLCKSILECYTTYVANPSKNNLSFPGLKSAVIAFCPFISTESSKFLVFLGV